MFDAIEYLKYWDCTIYRPDWLAFNESCIIQVDWNYGKSGYTIRDGYGR